MQLSAQQIFKTAHIYFGAINLKNNTFTCHQMQRDDYVQNSFLDDRLISSGDRFNTNTEALLSACDQKISTPLKRLSFIFHLAFGGSTLISRCLDKPGVCLAYKEPYLIHQLSFLTRKNWIYKTIDNEPRILDKKLAGLSIDLLSRTFDPEELPLIKPSESCNNLIASLLNSRPYAKGIILYTNLTSFAVSMLKHKTRRDYMKASLTRAQTDLEHMGFKTLKYDGLTDGEAVAYLWFSQMVHFYSLLKDDALPLRSLYAPNFFDRPVEVLMALSNYYNMQHEEADFQKHVENGAFTKDAKFSDKTYNAQTELKEKEAAQQKLQNEIDQAYRWIEDIKKTSPFPDRLPKALV